MSCIEKDYVDENEITGGTVILKKGLLLRDLVNHGSIEITLDASRNDYKELDIEKRMDTCYDLKDIEPYMNLDCIPTDMSSDDHKTPFDVLRGKMSNIISDGGIRKLVKRKGSGVVVPKKAVIYIHYNSYLEMEEVPFDTSYLRSRKPLRFKLGTGSMYPGFEIAVSSMQKNEQSQFLVDPKYGFGKMGVPPRIPPNATILLEIEVINCIDCGNTDCAVEEEDKKKFENAYKAAKSFHVLGNDYFSHKNILAAVDNYRKAKWLLLGCFMENEEEEEKQKKLLLKVCVNMCICYNDPKLRMPEKVCQSAKNAIFVCPEEAKNNPKLQYNWGKALMALNEFKRAGEHLRKALTLQPNNSDICQQLKLLEEKKKTYYEEEKICFKKALRLEKKPDRDCTDETNQVTAEFKAVMEENLDAFKESLQNRLQLPRGLTKEEKDVTREITENLGLCYQEESIGGITTITIFKNHTKPLTGST